MKTRTLFTDVFQRLNRAVFWVGVLVSLQAFAIGEVKAAVSSSSPQEPVQTLLEKVLKSTYSQAEIQWTGSLRWEGSEELKTAERVRILEEDSEGRIRFEAIQGEEVRYGNAIFSAWKQAWVPSKRVLPGQALQSEDFSLQRVEVSRGLGRVYRGIILGAEAELNDLEAKNTLLEGQFVISSAVKKIPDIRRGEAVRIKISTGGVILSTTGVAQEPAYLNAPIKVISKTSKQDFTGKLKSGKIVEVQL